MERTEQRAFVSYSTETQDLALALSRYLEERGWHCSTAREIPASSSWQDAVADAIEGADAVVLLVGSQTSEALRFEWSLALRASWENEQKRVVPVLLLGADPPPFLRNLATVRLTDDLDEEGFERVFQLISSQGGERSLEDSADEQLRLAERLDKAIEVLRSDSRNEAELREHREALLSSLGSSSGSAKAILCLSLGLLDAELGDHASSRHHLEAALREIEAEDDPAAERLLPVLMQLGEAQAEEGNYEAAIATFERVCAIQHEREPASIGEAAALQKLGIALVEVNRPEEARAHLSRALEISREALGREHPRVAALELWLAIAAEGAGDFEAARKVYEESLAEREEVGTEGLDDQVTRLLGLGHSLQQLGDLDGARQSLRRALRLTEHGEVESETVLTLCVALGDIEQTRGNLSEALALFERAMEAEAYVESDPPVIAALHFRVGCILFEMEDLPEAKKALSKALLQGEEAGEAGGRTVIDALFMLALVAQKEEDKAQAERRLQQAIDLETQRVPPDRRRLDEFRRALARLLESSAPAA